MDVGYFNLAYLQRLSAAGSDWLIRLKARTTVCDTLGHPLDWVQTLRRTLATHPHTFQLLASPLS